LFKDVTARIGDQESGSPWFGADRKTPAWGAAMAVATLRRCDAGRACLAHPSAWLSTGALACDVKLDREELSQLGSLDANAAAAGRNRG
jgi:hypothetical protein